MPGKGKKHIFREKEKILEMVRKVSILEVQGYGMLV